MKLQSLFALGNLDASYMPSGFLSKAQAYSVIQYVHCYCFSDCEIGHVRSMLELLGAMLVVIRRAPAQSRMRNGIGCFTICLGSMG